jgi:hypothetical protein
LKNNPRLNHANDFATAGSLCVAEIMAIGQCKSSAGSAIGDAKPNVQGDLIVRNFAVLDVPTSLKHLEPFHVFDAFGSFGNGVGNRVVNRGRRRANQFDFLVGMVISHGSSPDDVVKSVAANLLCTVWGKSLEKFSPTALS